MGGAETGCRPTPTSEGEGTWHKGSEPAIWGNAGNRLGDSPVSALLKVEQLLLYQDNKPGNQAIKTSTVQVKMVNRIPSQVFLGE